MLILSAKLQSCFSLVSKQKCIYIAHGFFFREKSDSQILRIFLSLVVVYFANINIRNRNCVILSFKMVGTTKWVVVVLALLIVVTKGKMSFEFYLPIFLKNY